jgi:hypothetical protein
MVRIPPGFHPQAVRHRGGQLAYRPGWRGTGMLPMTPTPIQAYTRRLLDVPLTGGQAQAAVPAGGVLALQTGPQGLGTIWYPSQVTVSTSTGPLDGSTCLVYLGYPGPGTPVTLVGTVFPGGGGTVALAVPPMIPGQILQAVWTGANPGDIAAINVTGTMDALTTG